MDTQIRRATRSDAETLTALSKRTINASYRRFLGNETVDQYISSGVVDQYVEDNIQRCSLIVADSDIFGYSVCRDNLIDLMMIDHDFHRRGFGTLLLEHCEKMLFRNFRELKLESFEENHKANDFYKRNGWIEMKRYFDESSGISKIVFAKGKSAHSM